MANQFMCAKFEGTGTNQPIPDLWAQENGDATGDNKTHPKATFLKLVTKMLNNPKPINGNGNAPTLAEDLVTVIQSINKPPPTNNDKPLSPSKLENVQRLVGQGSHPGRRKFQVAADQQGCCFH